MHWQYTHYVLPLVIATAMSAVLALFAWRRRPASGAAPLALLMLAVAVWTLGYTLELGSPDLPSKLFWGKVSYLGVGFVPVAWFTFVIQYTGREKWLSYRNLGVLAIEPLVTLLLVWTNEAHGMFYSNTRLDTSGPFLVLDLTYGVWFWVDVAYSYLLLLLGTLLLIQAFIHSPQLYRRQIGIMLIGTFAPWAAEVLLISGLSPFYPLDLTPFAFVLSGLALTWGLFRLQMLDMVPVARDAVIEGMSDGVIVLDAQHRIVDLNPAAQRVIGHSASEVIGQPAAQVLSGRPDLVERYRDVTEAREEIVLGESEAQRYFDLRISPLHNRRSGLTGRLVVFRDITERKRAEDALRESEERFQQVAENAQEWIWEVDTNGLYTYASPVVEKILGYRSEEVIGKKHFYDLFHPEDREELKKAAFVVFAKKQPFREFMNQNVHKNGKAVWLSTSGVPILDEGGNLLGYRGSDTDITERKQAEEVIKRIAYHDDLTGLPNRRLFNDHLTLALARAHRSRQSLAVMLLDLDNFKDVNDTLGHSVGDKLLRAVGDRLTSLLRKSDTVARMGGDEFLLLLPEIGGGEDAAKVAQKALEAFRTPFMFDGHELDITTSIGVAIYPEDGGDGDTLIKNADIAMYRAKDQGRDNHQRYTPAMNVKALG